MATSRTRSETRPGGHRMSAGTSVPDGWSSTEELVEFVVEAVRLGRVCPCGARLILLTRVLDVSIEQLAEETGTKALTLRMRRQRTEATLDAAAA